MQQYLIALLVVYNAVMLQGMDTYSNILFVKEAFAPLSHLATVHATIAGGPWSNMLSCVVTYISVQGMDTYSNILFVKEAFAPLSHLAHRLAASDKYTPEACCVIGNYYSLKVGRSAV